MRSCRVVERIAATTRAQSGQAAMCGGASRPRPRRAGRRGRARSRACVVARDPRRAGPPARVRLAFGLRARRAGRGRARSRPARPTARTPPPRSTGPRASRPPTSRERARSRRPANAPAVKTSEPTSISPPATAPPRGQPAISPTTERAERREHAGAEERQREVAHATPVMRSRARRPGPDRRRSSAAARATGSASLELGHGERPLLGGKKHAASCSAASASSGGSVSAHVSTARGQRGWKRQPLGGLIRFGTSPCSTNASRWRPSRGFASGTADSSAPVYGCRGAAYRSRARKLDELAQVHHRDAVGDVADDAQVVRDEDVRQPELRLEVLEQVEDLRLHRDVQRGDRLVGDDQLRVERERPRDPDPLPLTARELVRKRL